MVDGWFKATANGAKSPPLATANFPSTGSIILLSASRHQRASGALPVGKAGITDEFACNTDEFACITDEFAYMTDGFAYNTDEFACITDEFACITNEFACNTDEFACITEEFACITEEFAYNTDEFACNTEGFAWSLSESLCGGSNPRTGRHEKTQNEGRQSAR